MRPAEQWSRENDHATLARRFAERFTADERVLRAIELHDELYWIWNNGGDDIGPRATARARRGAVLPFRRA